MRLFITGGSGYLGGGLLKHAPSDWQIAGSYRTRPISHPNTVAIQLDIRHSRGVQLALQEFRPDVIIHAAALMSGGAMAATNEQGSRHIAWAAARLHARLIHLSSDVIFDGEHAPYAEDTAPSPLTPYAVTKALAEQAVRQEHPGALIVRTSLIYGFAPIDPRTRQTLMGEMPNLFTDEYRCPILVDDLARALIELASLEYSGVINVAGPQRLSRYEFGLKLAHALHAPVSFRPELSATSPQPRPRDCTLDISRAQALLRTPLRSVDDVLADLFNDQAANPFVAPNEY